VVRKALRHRSLDAVDSAIRTREGCKFTVRPVSRRDEVWVDHGRGGAIAGFRDRQGLLGLVGWARHRTPGTSRSGCFAVGLLGRGGRHGLETPDRPEAFGPVGEAVAFRAVGSVAGNAGDAGVRGSPNSAICSTCVTRRRGRRRCGSSSTRKVPIPSAHLRITDDDVVPPTRRQPPCRSTPCRPPCGAGSQALGGAEYAAQTSPTR